jgi:hypothetical protein
MRNKTFGDRIADVLIEDGLLLPNQLEEATAIQKEKGGRLLKILTGQTIRHGSGHGLQHGALPERVAGQFGADPDP